MNNLKHYILFCLIIVPACIFSQDTTTIKWKVLQTENAAMPRHENGFVECDGKFYALGGRGKKPIEVYDPKTNKWTKLAEAPIEFHHFQAIAFKREIYVIGAFTGGYPHEKPVPHFLIFNPETNTWRQGAPIPADRLRGSAGIFTRNNKIYVVCGIIDGHWDGHVKWFDEYDPKTGKWKILPDAPRARDHFQATMVGNSVYLAGGRTSHAAIGKVLELTIREVDVFDFKNNRWTTLSEGIPTPRAGTASIAKGQYLAVVNGESGQQVPAHAEVEILNTRTGRWHRLANLQRGRHGTGGLYYKGRLYVSAGSANRGGGPELNDIEYLQW